MESYQLVNKLDYSEDLHKDIAIKYDVGKVKTEKYGEAVLSGHFLLSTRHGEFPPVYIKEVEEKACIWLNEMGLEGDKDRLINKIQASLIVALSAPGIDPEKLEFYFKVMSFLFLFDDAITKVIYPNQKNMIRQQEEVIKAIENTVSIMRNHGSVISTEAAISNLKPAFKSSCIMLSHVCRYAFKEMCKDDYERLVRDMMDFTMVSKWLQEYRNSPYSKSEYTFLRLSDSGMFPVIDAIIFAKDIRISNEVRMHPLFRRYLDILNLHPSFSNDILSLPNEGSEKENFVFIKCEKYNLQKAILESEKTVNKLMLELKKCGMKLNLYYPSDNSLKDFVKAMEYMVDGILLWYEDCRRYGNTKFEKYVVKYDCDYNSWLKEICLEYMKEPTLSE